MRRLLLISALVITLCSCEKKGNNSNYKFFTGTFPKHAVNFEEINTEYDDYNSTAPSIGATFPLCFSSNRNSHGVDFDIVYKLISIDFSKRKGTLDIYENTSTNLDVYIENENIKNALNKINTLKNEFGPYLIEKGQKYSKGNTNGRYNQYILLYSNTQNGDQDIMFTHNFNSINYEAPRKVSFLNSEYDDAYPTLNKDNSEIYFTSNRESNFNIYKVKINSTNTILDNLIDKSKRPVEKVNILSSNHNDKCPFIYNNLMVFTSNRAGGFGGYDLYYSKFENGTWTEPINFGDKINTKYDEFRPIVREQDHFTNDFMLFSSNREGGKGGFDLYYVGIDKIL